MSRVGAAILSVLAVIALTGLALSGSPSAAWAQTRYPLDPAANIPPPAAAFGHACTAHPLRSKCEQILIRALDHARSVMGEPPYRLPSRFNALTGPEQLLVLSNQDRRLYRRGLITGFSATLNASARHGARHDADPGFVAVGGSWPVAAASTWAGGMASPLLSYYEWMYADGVSNGTSGNLDCRHAGDAGCWSHRHATLLRIGSSRNRVAMGVGHGRGPSGRPAWTELFEVFAHDVPVRYIPSLTALSRYFGSSAGGSTVTLAGFGLRRVTSVTFGSTRARFTRLSATRIRVVSPPNAAGRRHVMVTTRGGTSRVTGANTYTYR